MTQRSLPDALVEMLRFAFISALPIPQDRPVLDLSDSEILALTTVKMTEQQGSRLNKLLAHHSEKELGLTDYQELMLLCRFITNSGYDNLRL